MRPRPRSRAWSRPRAISPSPSTGTGLRTGQGCGCIPGRWDGPSSVCGSRAKKRALRAAEQDEAAIQEERQAWPEAIAGIAMERLVFLDESAAHTDLVRTHGWSPCGERAPGTAPCGRWERVTVLGALGAEGIVAAMGIQAATDGAVFCAYLDQVLLPELR